MAAAKAQGRLKEFLQPGRAEPKLLVVDEIGYLPFGRDDANLFFNVVAKRYERGSMVLTSNRPLPSEGQATPRPGCTKAGGMKGGRDVDDVLSPATSPPPARGD